MGSSAGRALGACLERRRHTGTRAHGWGPISSAGAAWRGGGPCRGTWLGWSHGSWMQPQASHQPLAATTSSAADGRRNGRRKTDGGWMARAAQPNKPTKRPPMAPGAEARRLELARDAEVDMAYLVRRRAAPGPWPARDRPESRSGRTQIACGGNGCLACWHPPCRRRPTAAKCRVAAGAVDRRRLRLPGGGPGGDATLQGLPAGLGALGSRPWRPDQKLLAKGRTTAANPGNWPSVGRR